MLGTGDKKASKRVLTLFIEEEKGGWEEIKEEKSLVAFVLIFPRFDIPYILIFLLGA